MSNVYIANTADIIGDVTLGPNANIWYQAVVRGDHNSITIGENTNVQDGCVLHTDDDYKLIIGDNVTIGHGAIVHGCTVGDNTLIGMGAIVLNGANVGADCLVAAGALVTQNMHIPDGSVVMGNPARIKRSVTAEEIEHNKKNAKSYVEYAKKSERMITVFCRN